MPVQIDTKMYESALRSHVLDLMVSSWDREQGRRQEDFDVEALAKEVERHIGKKHADGIRSHDLHRSHAAYKAITRLMDEGGDWDDLFEVSRQITNFILWAEAQKRSQTLEQVEAEAEREAESIISATNQHLVDFAKTLAAAAKRIPSWEGSSLLVQPMFDRDNPSIVPVTSFEVTVGQRATFSAFVGGSKTLVDDVLDVADRAFFREPSDASDYINLVKELRRPGSASKGHKLTLYTARPTKDRSLYQRGKIPPGVYLTTDPNRAAGIAHDLGAKEVRDLWRVQMSSAFLVETLAAGSVRDYQVIGKKPAPAKMLLIQEGSRTASAAFDVRNPKELTDVGDALEALESVQKLLQQKRLLKDVGGVVVVLTDSITGGGSAVYFESQDVIYLDVTARRAFNTTFTLAHELGHRFWHRAMSVKEREKYTDLYAGTAKLFLTREDRLQIWKAWKASGFNKRKIRLPADLKEKWRAFAKDLERAHMALVPRPKEGLTEQVIERYFLRAREKYIFVDSAKPKSVTSYGSTAVEEDFAESFAFYVTGRPLPEHVKLRLGAILRRKKTSQLAAAWVEKQRVSTVLDELAEEAQELGLYTQ